MKDRYQPGPIESSLIFGVSWIDLRVSRCMGTMTMQTFVTASSCGDQSQTVSPQKRTYCAHVRILLLSWIRGNRAISVI